MQQALGPRAHAGGPALTKQLSIEQETRAVRLMVAGGLGQRTCPRSRCAARQSRALAASRLWGPPGAAAEARRQARWRRGLGSTPARLFPPLHNGARPAPPSDTRAKGRGAKRGKRPKPRGGRRGRAGSSAPPRCTDSSLPAAPRRGRESSGMSRGFRGSGLRGCPQTAGKGKARRLHLFISHLPR